MNLEALRPLMIRRSSNLLTRLHRILRLQSSIPLYIRLRKDLIPEHLALLRQLRRLQDVLDRDACVVRRAHAARFDSALDRFSVVAEGSHGLVLGLRAAQFSVAWVHVAGFLQISLQGVSHLHF